ncbi:hypothetical protein M406DRAFT_265578 [Cryphonectria parasitica EP155]|uniref:Cyclase n=1 Tax=Cryphonectria parasitica (strain ATCC 38755 / EP155) TaxID=660469 RepID=A0A9P4XWI3_CRYP1|nr:uncharacterized protein M406DRAFT_265578 [Cryphonectria parasitica EP155]KAF3761865.1 hypothetical protein M406DRAFT_265578 [Cryphonectria parasitica EP155]
MPSPRPRPSFDELPLDKSGPPGNAWGLYGDDDVLGALNLLTPEVIAQAARENIQTGQRVALDWQLNKPSRPSFDRPAFQWTLRPSSPAAQQAINDDHLSFNTQCSSQWDGFRHFGYQKARRFYGGRTQGDIEGSAVLGIDAWAASGGIVGRGVLLDYVSFCERRHLPTVDALASASIPLAHLQAMARDADVAFRPGDILFIRCGFTKAYNALDEAGQHALPDRPTPDFLGVEPSKDTLRWLWESGFAAVAGDAPSFEQAPPWEHDMRWGGLLHQWLLAGWGVPIGEMFDLEELSVRCKELGRWTFFLSSVPLNVPGGVATPPNAVAIF